MCSFVVGEDVVSAREGRVGEGLKLFPGFGERSMAVPFLQRLGLTLWTQIVYILDPPEKAWSGDQVTLGNHKI